MKTAGKGRETAASTMSCFQHGASPMSRNGVCLHQVRVSLVCIKLRIGFRYLLVKYTYKGWSSLTYPMEQIGFVLGGQCEFYTHTQPRRQHSLGEKAGQIADLMFRGTEGSQFKKWSGVTPRKLRFNLQKRVVFNKGRMTASCPTGYNKRIIDVLIQPYMLQCTNKPLRHFTRNFGRDRW